MSHPVDPTAIPGPGRVHNWGWVTFPTRSKRHRMVTVTPHADGSVAVEWTEPTDDFFGSATRTVSFSAEEFEQVCRLRAAITSVHENAPAPVREARGTTHEE